MKSFAGYYTDYGKDVGGALYLMTIPTGSFATTIMIYGAVLMKARKAYWIVFCANWSRRNVSGMAVLRKRP
jgi:hypothetical protein